MITSKYDLSKLSFSVNLHRYYIGFPNDVGTTAAYNERITQIASNFPSDVATALLLGLDIHVHDMDDELLDQEIAKGQANLQDVYIETKEANPGYGLYWDRIKKLQLAVFHDGWKADVSPSPNTIQSHNVIAALDTLPHELGHHLSFLIGFNRNAGFASTEITRIIMPMLTAQANTPEENFAEHFRCLFGCYKTKGTFSDGKRAFLPDKLKQALAAALPTYNRIKTKAISDLAFDGTSYSWKEWEMKTRFFLFVPYPSWEVSGKFSMASDGILKRV